MRWAQLASGCRLVLAGCVDPPDLPPVTAYDTASLSRTRLKAVLVAGDDSIPVFRNAVLAVAERLQRAGVPAADMARLTADGATPATAANVMAAVEALRPVDGQGCLVFITSHGLQSRGLVLQREHDLLTPAALDRALATGCGNAPTVVIASGCYTGTFAAAPMARANRIILTAAREDRTSFGCAATRTYSVFDRCLLTGLDIAHSWQEVHAVTAACVAFGESQQHIMLASEPQAHFGSALAVWPWQRASVP